MKRENSRRFYQQATESLVGGVNSPVRAFRGVGGDPLFITQASGATITDADGNEYIDYVGSWGPMVLGHSHPRVIEAVKQAAARGTSFGAPTKLEIELAEKVKELVPSVELVRMVNSGTEAAMSAVRLARGYTGRDKVIKFDGCYHGHADGFLIQAGSGALTLGTPDSPGVPATIVEHTLGARFNDISSVEALAQEYSGEIAAVIIEPVAGNMGVIPPEPGFLQDLRNLCDTEGICLIFDEVMTGFRVAPGGAQERYEVQPDLSVFGKVIGGGLPVGAFGGKREIMEKLAPLGPVYQAGTLSGNPLAMAAGLETLKVLQEDSIYDQLEEKAACLEMGLKKHLDNLGMQCYQTKVGSMGCLFFNSGRVRNYEEAKESDTEKYAKYFHAMLERGIYLAPSQFEAMFISQAHSKEDIERTVEAAGEALKTVAG